jgi:hypothetical protein
MWMRHFNYHSKKNFLGEGTQWRNIKTAIFKKFRQLFLPKTSRINENLFEKQRKGDKILIFGENLYKKS